MECWVLAVQTMCEAPELQEKWEAFVDSVVEKEEKDSWEHVDMLIHFITQAMESGSENVVAALEDAAKHTLMVDEDVAMRSDRAASGKISALGADDEMHEFLDDLPHEIEKVKEELTEKEIKPKAKVAIKPTSA